MRGGGRFQDQSGGGGYIAPCGPGGWRTGERDRSIDRLHRGAYAESARILADRKIGTGRLSQSDTETERRGFGVELNFRHLDPLDHVPPSAALISISAGDSPVEAPALGAAEELWRHSRTRVVVGPANAAWRLGFGRESHSRSPAWPLSDPPRYWREMQ